MTIVRLQRGDEVRYVEWSTVVDAPVTGGMTRAELELYYAVEYGRRGAAQLPARLARADAHGTSSFVDSLDGLIATNRAGPGESRLTLDQIWDRYCIEEAAL